MSYVQKELVVGGTTFGAIFGGFFSGLVRFNYTNATLSNCFLLL